MVVIVSEAVREFNLKNKQVNNMTEIIYTLVDSDGETICAFKDKNTAIREAKETGCDVEELNLYF